LLPRIFVILCIALCLLLLLAVGVAWAPDRPVESLLPRWAPPPSAFLEIEGLQAHVRDEGPAGEPLPVLLLHGTSSSLHTWDGWAEVLARQRRVVRVDLPGFGLTGPFPHDDYDIPRYLDFLVALLDRLGIERVVVAGNSFGGQLAWELAAEVPERVAGLVLVDAAGYPFTPESVPIGFRIAGQRWLQPLTSILLPRAMVESSVRDVYGDPSRVDPELVDRYYELTLREGNRRALALRLAHAIPTAERAARIATLTQPTLILWGGSDRLIPADHGERFTADIPWSRLVLFPDLGHVPHEEAPDETLEPVLFFLRGF
jgi:pimeloyl-ACP methyl ester carboxylesterase